MSHPKVRVLRNTTGKPSEYMLPFNRYPVPPSTPTTPVRSTTPPRRDAAQPASSLKHGISHRQELWDVGRGDRHLHQPGTPNTTVPYLPPPPRPRRAPTSHGAQHSPAQDAAAATALGGAYPGQSRYPSTTPRHQNRVKGGYNPWTPMSQAESAATTCVDTPTRANRGRGPKHPS